MKSTVTMFEFVDSFTGSYKDNFSYEGKKALFEYLEQYEEDAGEELELDPIAFCCEYSEFENLEELQANYNNIESMEDLENHTTVIPVDNTGRFIIQDF